MTQSNSGSSFPAWLAYLAGFITGLIGLSVEKDDQSVRFHCAQAIGFSIFLVVLSIVLAIVGMILGLIPLLGAILMGLINLIVWIAALVLWILLMVRAGSGQTLRLPIIADFSEKYFINLFK